MQIVQYPSELGEYLDVSETEQSDVYIHINQFFQIHFGC